MSEWTQTTPLLSEPVVSRSDGQTYAVVEKLPRGGKAIIFLFFFSKHFKLLHSTQIVNNVG